MTELIYKQVYYDIVYAAIEVWKTLRYGFLEKAYENALAMELHERGFNTEQQKPIKVYYKEQMVGEYFTDIIVNDAILLELKSAEAIATEHVAQTLNYLRATGIQLGILLNFGPSGLEHTRLVM